jgi:hypothetical protein
MVPNSETGCEEEAAAKRRIEADSRIDSSGDQGHSVFRFVP